MPVYKGATMSWDTFKRMTAYDVENQLRDELQRAMRAYYGKPNTPRTRAAMQEGILPIVRRTYRIPRQNGKPYRTYRKLETYGLNGWIRNE